MRSVKIITSITAIAIVSAVVGVFLILFNTSNSSAEAPESFRLPVNMNGSWHQNTNDNTPAKMTAEIDNGHVEIMMESSAVSGLYWGGSFDTKNMYDPYQMVSVSDEEAISQSHTKTFYYKNGDLSFIFSMLGKTYTVHMSRGA